MIAGDGVRPVSAVCRASNVFLSAPSRSRQGPAPPTDSPARGEANLHHEFSPAVGPAKLTIVKLSLDSGRAAATANNAARAEAPIAASWFKTVPGRRSHTPRMNNVNHSSDRTGGL